MKYEKRVLKVVVCPEKKPIYDEMCTFVEIEDEAGGEYIKISQNIGETIEAQTVSIDADEWVVLRGVIDEMVKNCRSYE